MLDILLNPEHIDTLIAVLFAAYVADVLYILYAYRNLGADDEL